MQSSVSCNVILDSKEMKFLEGSELGAGFRLRKNGFPLSKNANFKKLFLIMAPS